MSQLQAQENGPAPEHEREAVPSNPDYKSSNGVSGQAGVPVAAVDGESEPVVIRKELWSYYRMPLHDSLCSCEETTALQCTMMAITVSGLWYVTLSCWRILLWTNR